jgi:hypothetical protein
MDTKPSPVETSVPVNDIPQAGNAVIFKADSPAGSSITMPKLNIKLALASFLMFFLVGGVGVGVYLVGQQQQVKSRASNDVPENISAVVPKNVVNTATASAQPASASAKPSQTTASSSLANISIPEFDSSASAGFTSSESAELSDMYDFNDDSAANSVDLSIMYAGWGTPKNEEQKNADLNGDGIINGIDYSIFLPHFNQPL